MAGIAPAVNPLPVAGLVNPTPQIVVDPTQAGLVDPTSPLGVATQGLPLLGGTANPVGPPAFTQTELMVVLAQLMQNLGNIGRRGNSVATAYLRNNGAYSISPLEQGVKVRQADDSGYFQALGYQA